MSSKENVYKEILKHIFFSKFDEGRVLMPFERTEIGEAAIALGLDVPQNLGDVIYNARYRAGLSEEILATQPEGMEWIIEGMGQARYAFKLTKYARIVPDEQLLPVKIPDATPEVVLAHALSDEQALLAKVRYNRLIDLFGGCVAYSLQNHLRTAVEGIGQIEIDELYIGIHRNGSQFVMPIQAKGGSDHLGVVQTTQDISYCEKAFPSLICRPIAAQFLNDDLIAMFELTSVDGEIRKVHEKHYQLVATTEITEQDLDMYKRSDSS